MHYVVSRYNHDLTWINEYTKKYTLYDRSEKPLKGAIVVPNIGSDIYDKLTYIIDNYKNLPQVVCLIKANLFKYISKEEFDMVKDTNVFTPLLTQNHRVYEPICRYVDGMYEEINNYWYLNHHKAERASELVDFLGIRHHQYLQFAPGSNYIVPRGNILKHPKEFYVKLRSFLEHGEYPGEAMIIERALYTIWKH